MNKKHLAIGATAIFAGAFTLGEVVMKKAVLKKMEQHKSLINGLVYDAIQKSQEGLSPEEYKAWLKENIDFMGIVISGMK